MIFNADNGKYRFKQFITPRVRQILLAIFTECDPQFIHLSLSQENWILLPFQSGCC